MDLPPPGPALGEGDAKFRLLRRRAYLEYHGLPLEARGEIPSGIAASLGARGYTLSETVQLAPCPCPRALICIGTPQGKKLQISSASHFAVLGVVPKVWGVSEIEWALSSRPKHPPRSRAALEMMKSGASDAQIALDTGGALAKVRALRAATDSEKLKENAMRKLGPNIGVRKFKEAVLRMQDPADRTIFWFADPVGWRENSLYADCLRFESDVLVLRGSDTRHLEKEFLRSAKARSVVIIDLSSTGHVPSRETVNSILGLAEKIRDGALLPAAGPLPLFVFAHFCPELGYSGMDPSRWALCIPGAARGLGHVVCGRAGQNVMSGVVANIEEADTSPVQLLDAHLVIAAVQEYRAAQLRPGEDHVQAAWRELWNAFSPRTVERFWRAGYQPQICISRGWELCLDPLADQGLAPQEVGSLMIVPRPLTPAEKEKLTAWLRPNATLDTVNNYRLSVGLPLLETLPSFETLHAEPEPAHAPAAPPPPRRELLSCPSSVCSSDAVRPFYGARKRPTESIKEYLFKQDWLHPIEIYPGEGPFAFRTPLGTIGLDSPERLRSPEGAAEIAKAIASSPGGRHIRILSKGLWRWDWRGALDTALRGTDKLTFLEHDIYSNSWALVRLGL